MSSFVVCGGFNKLLLIVLLLDGYLFVQSWTISSIQSDSLDDGGDMMVGAANVGGGVLLKSHQKRNPMASESDNKSQMEKDDDSAEDSVEDQAQNQDAGPLRIASIKSRAIAMDPELCRELSRYHPHYPRCYEYCKKLLHWMGMCVHSSCHCYS